MTVKPSAMQLTDSIGMDVCNVETVGAHITDKSITHSEYHDITADKKRLLQFYTEYQHKNRYRHSRNDTDDTLNSIELFVTACIYTDQPGFKLEQRKAGTMIIRQSLLGRAYFRRISNYLSAYSPEYHYSPTINLFFTAALELGLFGHDFVLPSAIDLNGSIYAEHFNQLVERVRQLAKATPYRKQLNRIQGRSFAKFMSLISYVDALFKHVRSRFILIRLDLRYKDDCSREIGIEQAQQDLKHFFANMRTKPSLFEDLAGYIWTLEYGETGSHHFHLLLFFTNDRFYKDGGHARKLKAYWDEVITKGRGDCFYCNSSEYKRKQKKLFLGRVEHTDYDKRYFLLDYLAYICKPSQRVLAKRAFTNEVQRPLK